MSPPSCTRTTLVTLLASALWSSPALTQGASARPSGPHATPVAAPARDASGPRTLRVARLSRAVHIDGRLDDEAWALVPSQRGFTQIEPRQGAPATLDTEVRLAQDDDYLYVAMRADDPAGRRGLRARDLRRDFYWGRSDAMGIILDGVGDRRSILAFGVSAFGALWDAQVTDGGLVDLEWDTVWHARTTADSVGWTAEFAIPWASLRYAMDVREWRINVIREAPRIGETTVWSAFPRNVGPFRMEFAAPVEGIVPPAATAPVLLRPYVVTSQRLVGDRERRAAVGGEVKWQPSASTAVDLTVNTDFAQADVDRQVVNLTRFNVFFPERRQFFLEHRGLFTVGAPERLLPFFTRAVGMTPGGLPLPIEAGVRAVHRGARWSAGGLAVRQGARDGTPAASLGVLRLQGMVGPRLRLGALAVDRREDDAPSGATATPSAQGSTLALDAFARPTPTLAISGLFSTTSSRGMGREGTAWWGEAVRSTPGLEAAVGVEYVGRHYAPAAGFVARGDLLRATGRAVADWRPSWRPRAIRSFRPALSHAIAWRASDRAFQEAQVTARLFGTDFVDRGRAFVDVVADWQSLDRPFTVIPGLAVAPGSYRGARVTTELQSSFARPLAATIGLTVGSYFDGTLRGATTRLAWAPRPQVVFETAHTVSRFDGVGGQGRRVTHLLAPELRLAATPRTQLAVFYQHNTSIRQGALNARLAWEYAPLSTLVIVYNSRSPLPQRGEVPVAAPARDGQVVVKLSLTRLP